MPETVLLVDDEPHILAAYKRQLGAHFNILTACDADSALKRMDENGSIAVIVSDLKMPGMDGIGLLRSVKQQYPDVGRILLTGHGDLNAVADAINEGGIEKYLTKPIPTAVLSSCIAEAIKNHLRQTEMRAAVEKLNGNANRTVAPLVRDTNIDPITGLLSRKATAHALDVWIRDLESRNQIGAIAIVDIDRFSDMIATWGERSADRVLSATADRIAGLVEDRSIVGRWGRNTIVFTMESAESADLIAIFLDLMAEVLEENVQWQGETIPLSVSIGAARARLDDVNLSGTMRCAENALVAARKKGPGNTHIYRSAQVASKNDIAQAFRQGEFELLFQPQFDIQTGAFVGAQALPRRRHPIYGLQEPSEFMVDAERENMTAPIGAWAVTEACKAMNRWACPTEAFFLTVGVWASCVDTPGFIETVRKAIREENIDPSNLELEIAESEKLILSPFIAESMAALHDLGISLTIDDVGTDHATLGSLVEFSFNKMKVNKAFIEQLGRDEKIEEVLRWIAVLSHANGMTVIADGVETDTQLQRLRELQYDLVQGALLSRVLSEKDFTIWMAARG